MDPLIIFGLLLIGGAFGFALGKIKAVQILRPMIDRMSNRILVLESELIRRVLDDDQDGQLEAIPEEMQIRILEHWNDLEAAMSYTQMEQFRDASTGYVDWAKYRRAQQENGERCFECGAYLIRFLHLGSVRSCGECESLRATHEVEHHSKVRCPGCGDTWEVVDLFQQGEHSVRCDNCDCEFTVETKISYSFVSPERIKDSLDEEEETADGV